MSEMTREQKKAAKRQAWLNAPIAYVEKPLRFLRGKLVTRDEKGNTVVDPLYTFAYNAAGAGRGDIVRNIARDVALQGA